MAERTEPPELPPAPDELASFWGSQGADQAAQEEVIYVVEELQAMQLERQPSAASSDAGSGNGGGSEQGSGGALFAGQEEEDASAAPAPPAPHAGGDAPAGSADQQRQQQQQQQQEEQDQKQQLVALRCMQAGGTAGSSAAPPAPPEEAQLEQHPKHVFVFSTAGKPIFSYRGDESRLAGLMATAEAILSVAHSKGHTLKHVRAGSHVFVFLERPPLCLVGVSALAEPPAVLRMQLTLVHGQIISLLTSTALNALFARNPGYDARNLLGGSEGMLSSLIDSFTSTPATLLGAYPSLPLLGGVRQALASALAAAIKATGALHGLVVAAGHVAATCGAPGLAPLQQWDLLLLLNLLGANASFRHSGEAMTPVCLPRFNASANLHAYISYADAATQTATVLLCGGMPNPAALSAAAQHMQQQLEAVGALQALVQSAAREQLYGGSSSSSSSSGSMLQSDAGPAAAQPTAAVNAAAQSAAAAAAFAGRDALLAVPNLPAAAGGGRFGATPLLHFVYKLSGRQQYVMSPFCGALQEGGLRQAIVVAYSQLRAAMFESSTVGSGPLQRLRYEARPRFVLLGAVNPETELYLTCDPLADQAEAAALASRLGMWLHSRHDQLFSLG
ncbi:hypothetical protein ABPG75_010359 [Micractinium tetrahymenae]